MTAKWSHGNVVESADEFVIPPEQFSPDEVESGSYKMMLVSGGVAGAMSRTCTAPIDRVKILLQVHGYKHTSSGIASVFKYMLKEGGVRSLWRGNGVSVIKIAPETAIKYSSYEFYKRWLLSTQTRHGGELFERHPALLQFVAGSMAGSTAQSAIYPLEVLKTRMCLRNTGQYSSLLHCIRDLFREGGLRSFYRGYFLNIAGIIPYAGIELTLYEGCRSLYLEHINNKKRRERRENGLESSGGQQEQEEHPSFYIVPLFAAISSSAGIAVTYPSALLRSKYQSKCRFEQAGTNTLRGLFTTIWRTSGLRGFYRGMLPAYLKVLPATSINFLTLELFNRYYCEGGLHFAQRRPPPPPPPSSVPSPPHSSIDSSSSST